MFDYGNEKITEMVVSICGKYQVCLSRVNIQNDISSLPDDYHGGCFITIDIKHSYNADIRRIILHSTPQTKTYTMGSY